MALGPHFCFDCRVGDHEKCDGRGVLNHHRCECGCYEQRWIAGLQQQPYLSISALLNRVDPCNKEAFRRLYDHVIDDLGATPGSRHNHQAWQGGYVDHVVEACNFAKVLYEDFHALRPFPFSLEEVTEVLLLHDIEKPWKYAGVRMDTKEKRQQFREQVVAQYGITLTLTQMNALQYCEGEGSDYSPLRRVMEPLAAFCNMCDVMSARIWHDKGRAANWKE